MTAYGFGYGLGMVIFIAGLLALIWFLHKIWHKMKDAWQRDMPEARRQVAEKKARKAAQKGAVKSKEEAVMPPENNAPLPGWATLEDDLLTPEQREYRAAKVELAKLQSRVDRWYENTNKDQDNLPF